MGAPEPVRDAERYPFGEGRIVVRECGPSWWNAPLQSALLARFIDLGGVEAKESRKENYLVGVPGSLKSCYVSHMTVRILIPSRLYAGCGRRIADSFFGRSPQSAASGLVNGSHAHWLYTVASASTSMIPVTDVSCESSRAMLDPKADLASLCLGTAESYLHPRPALGT